jgi:DNA-binding response OmpR family regulator
VLLFSSDRSVRAAVMAAIGRRPAADLPPVAFVETATEPATIAQADTGEFDLIILDGEARPGGMGIARQLKDEIYECPPTLVLTARPDDAWLATWSRADAVVPRPLDPFDLARASATLLRRRLAAAQG